jgi:hypothetical protein
LESRREDEQEPTTSIYNASVVNFYNATGSPAGLENKKISIEKHSRFLNSRRRPLHA